MMLGWVLFGIVAAITVEGPSDCPAPAAVQEALAPDLRPAERPPAAAAEPAAVVVRVERAGSHLRIMIADAARQRAVFRTLNAGAPCAAMAGAVASPVAPQSVGGALRLCPPVRITGQFLAEGTEDLTRDPFLIWDSQPQLARSADSASGAPLFDASGNPCFDPGTPAVAAGTTVTTTVNYLGGPTTPARFSWSVGP